jgi:ligand-binding sensor domain-containing protein/two-component sensor histidine kinase
VKFVLCLALLRGFLSVKADELPARSYTSADGLPMSRMNDILNDSQGFMWFATNQGLTRFDGYEFRTFGVEDGLPSKTITALMQDRDGTYWLGTNTGLCHFDGIHFKFYPLAPGGYVTTLFQDNIGRIWCGSTDGLFLLKRHSGNDAALERVPVLPAGERIVMAITGDQCGAVWAAFLNTLFRLKDGEAPMTFTAANGVPKHISSLLTDSKGRIWMGSWCGLYRLNSTVGRAPVVERSWTQKDGLGSNIIHALFRSHDGTIWVLTEHGLSSWQEGSDPPAFHVHHDVQGWLAGRDEAAAEDRRGSLWIGTESHGVIRVSLNGLTTLGGAEGLLSNKVRDLFTDQAGDLVAVTRIDTQDSSLGRRYPGQVLYRVGDETLRPVNPAYPRSLQNAGWGESQIVLQDHLGEWWVSSGQGLYRFPAVPLNKLPATRPVARYTKADGLLGSDVYRLHEDRAGDIWVGTMDRGIFRWRRKLRQFQPAGVLRMCASAFQDDDAGNVWIGWWGERELGRFRDGRFETFNAGKGLSPGWVTDIFKDHRGRLWVTTTGGLSRIDKPSDEAPKIHSYAEISGLSGHRLQCVTEDRHGILYVGSDNGLDAFNPASGALRHFGVKDGLPDETVLSAACDRKGILWFGTHGGLVRLQPVSWTKSQEVPLRIVGLQSGGQPWPLSKLGESKVENLRLSPGENVLQIDYTDLAFGAAGQLHFQYLLEGTAGWSPATKDRTLHFAGLRPDSYRLSIRAVDTLGQPVSAPITASFRVLPQFWQTWWFQVFCLVGAVAVGVVIHRYRMSRLIAVQKLRSRIAFDLHDEVGSGLTQIAIWSELARRDGRQSDAAHLEQIAASSRSLVDSIGDIIWTVNPKRDSVRELVQRVRYFATEICTARDINLKFEASGSELDREANSEIRRDVFLIAKEAIHNAVRHAGCSRMDVSFCVLTERLELEIADNGCGLAAGMREGNGLASMRQRARALRGNIEWLAGGCSDSAGRGTRVRLTIPLHSTTFKRVLRKLPV